MQMNAANPEGVKTLELVGGELFDGRKVNVIMMACGGIRQGPILYMGAAIHGDEVTGTEIVRQVVEKVQNRKLSGTLIAVAVQNPLAYVARSRFAPAVAVGSPTDMYQIFPGCESGDPSERIAHLLFGKMSEADYVLDIHSATVGARNAAYAWVPSCGSASVKTRSIDLAKWLGMDFIIIHQLPNTRILHNAVANLGIPSLTVELGEGGRIDQEFVERGVSGILNVMKHIKILDEAPEDIGRQIVLTEIMTVRANRGGLLIYECQLGEKVNEGTLLATIVRPYEGIVESLKAPATGYLIKTINVPTVNAGERIAVVGIE